MTDKDSHAVRVRRRVDPTPERAKSDVGGAGSGRPEQSMNNEPKERLHRVYTDVRIRAHHTNAELKMMRESGSGVEGHQRKF